MNEIGAAFRDTLLCAGELMNRCSPLQPRRTQGPKYGGHDSHGQHGRGPAPALVQKSENSDMAYCKELERQV